MENKNQRYELPESENHWLADLGTILGWVVLLLGGFIIYMTVRNFCHDSMDSPWNDKE